MTSRQLIVATVHQQLINYPLHSPALRLADLVAELGGAFVIFDFDGPGQFLSELGQVRAALAGTPVPPRRWGTLPT